MSEFLDIPRLYNGINHELYEGRYGLEQLSLIHRNGLPIDLKTQPVPSKEDTNSFTLASYREAYEGTLHTLTGPNPQSEEDIMTFATASQLWGDDFNASLTLYERTQSQEIKMVSTADLTPEELDEFIQTTVRGASLINEDDSIFLAFQGLYTEFSVRELRDIQQGFISTVGLSRYLGGEESAATTDILKQVAELPAEDHRRIGSIVIGTIDDVLMSKISRTATQL